MIIITKFKSRFNPNIQTEKPLEIEADYEKHLGSPQQKTESAAADSVFYQQAACH